MGFSRDNEIQVLRDVTSRTTYFKRLIGYFTTRRIGHVAHFPIFAVFDRQNKIKGPVFFLFGKFAVVFFFINFFNFLATSHKEFWSLLVLLPNFSPFLASDDSDVNLPRRSGSTLKFRQLSDGKHLIQSVYDGDYLVDCEFGHSRDQIKKFLNDFKNDLSTLVLSHNVSVISLDNVELPSDYKWLNYSTLRDQCHVKHIKIKESIIKYNESLENNTRNKRAISDMLRFPGTKWCGKGYSADKYTRLGGFSKTDKCCRRHDMRCHAWIGAFQTKYGLFNWRVNTLMHCRCDEKSGSTLKFRQLSDGKHLIQSVYDGDYLVDCEFGHSRDQIKKFLNDFKNDLNTLVLSHNVSVISLDNVELPSDYRWLNYSTLRDQCHVKHIKIKESIIKYNESLENNTRNKRAISDMLRFPGTKWCGKGYSADKYTRLGGFSKTDKCCRRHDMRCHAWIGAFQTKYGLFNWRVNTLMHCRCDEKFRACLKLVGSSDANLVGKLFFNVVQSKCFILKPKKVCAQYSWWGQKCKKYKKIKQAVLRDNLPY